MRWYLVPLLVAVALPAIGIAQEKAKELEGTWQVTKIVSDGKEVPEEKIKEAKFVFKAGKLTMTRGGEEQEKFDYKIDAAKKPKTIDLIEKDATAAGIYKFDGDNLTICLPKRGSKDRPTEFKAEKGSDASVITLKRVKEK
jgi:uncharacterized protein (TIGR03067 family)